MPEERTYLELSEGDAGSHKFYEVIVTDATLNIRYGRIGDNGQSQSKTFPSFDKAKAEADKKIKEKLNKGYERAVQGVRKKRAVTHRVVVSTPSKARTAPILWNFTTASSAFGIFVDDALAWVGNQDGKIFAVDHAGTVQASFKLPEGVKCLVADQDWLYAGCDDGNVYDLTGKVPRVAYEISDSVDILWIDVRDGTLAVSDNAGKVHTFNHEDENQWTQNSGGYGWMVRCDEIGVYHGHGTGVTMYDLGDGSKLWEQRTAAVLFGWQEEAAVYAATTANIIEKFSKKGERKGSYRCDASVFSCATSPDGKFVFAGDNSSSIYCFAEDGTRLWKFGTGFGSALSMQYHKEKLYLVTTGGNLICLDASETAIQNANAGTVPATKTIAAPKVEAHQTQVETTSSVGTGVVVECVMDGGKARVRVVSEGFNHDWWVQFPKDIREVGTRYVVAELRAAERGGFYRAHGDIKKLR
jgi:outer membrane protein assembly factor BamB